MPNEIDLSDRALRARRAIAEKATPGPWAVQIYNGGPYPGPFQIWSQSAPNAILVSISVEGSRNCAHIAANSPDVIMADIDEILHLRAEVERLNKEADWLAERISIRDCVMGDTVENCIYKEFPCAECFREAARKAVEESHA